MIKPKLKGIRSALDDSAPQINENKNIFKFHITEALKLGKNTLLLLLGGNKLTMHTDQYSSLKQTLITCQILTFSQITPSFCAIQL